MGKKKRKRNLPTNEPKAWHKQASGGGFHDDKHRSKRRDRRDNNRRDNPEFE